MTSSRSSRPRKALVAVVDGNVDQQTQVAAVLSSRYRVVPFADSDRAMAEMLRHPPAVLLIDENVPPSGGTYLIERLRRLAPLAAIPIIFITASQRQFSAQDSLRLGVNATLVRPYRRSALLETVGAVMNRVIETRWEGLPETQRASLQKTMEMYNGVSNFIANGEAVTYPQLTAACSPLIEVVRRHEVNSLLSSVKGHDDYSYTHSLRVATLLAMFGHTIGLDDDELMVLATGGLLHDIGKMSIPQKLLNKPGMLVGGELELMRSHVTKTVDYLQACPNLPKGIVTIAGQHHERLDGSGYPHGLVGSQLGNLARMVSIIDVFSALTDLRCYKPAVPAEKALTVMAEDMTAYLDQGLLAKFRDMLLTSIHE
jgi:putative nucleotidyltransferase with HDIG domain